MIKKILTLSFDDGVMQDVRFVELLNKYHIKCTFNLNSGLFGNKHDLSYSDDLKCDHTEITADMVKDLYEGHEVAVHTLTHPSLSSISPDSVIHEVEDDRLALEKLCGYHIMGMAYPGGTGYNDSVIKNILQNTGVRYARTIAPQYNFNFPERFMEWHPTCCILDDKLFDLTDKFLNTEPADGEPPYLFYVWGHSYEFDMYNNWNLPEEFFKMISNRVDIVYATNAEIFNYCKSGRFSRNGFQPKLFS